ncbi:MAG: hypothetical protein ACJ77K_04850 [Bacteroidia bacterium]
MKRLIFISVMAVVAVQIAKRYNIKSLDDLKELILPKLEDLKNMIMPGVKTA